MVLIHIIVMCSVCTLLYRRRPCQCSINSEHPDTSFPLVPEVYLKYVLTLHTQITVLVLRILFAFRDISTVSLVVFCMSLRTQITKSVIGHYNNYTMRGQEVPRVHNVCTNLETATIEPQHHRVWAPFIIL